MKKLFLSFFFALSFSLGFCQTTIINPQTDKELLKNFQNRKLGLFVHFMACFTPKTGDSWSIGNGTPKSVSDSITLAWDPEKFNAKDIVDFAIKAGCKYIVVVAKHHDGFSIWESKYTDFDLARLKFKKDILKELGDEAKKRGLLFGIYYSIADLHYTGWSHMPEAGTPPPPPKDGEPAFIDFVHNQVKELINNYNPDILWFDGFWLEPYWDSGKGKDLYNFIKQIKPNTLSTRLAATKDSTKHETFIPDGSSGDFFSVEAKTKDAPQFPWEACTSVSYPVYAYDPNAKLLTKAQLVLMFDKTICGNGNFLLNIGPDRDGSLPKRLTDRFLAFSNWVNQYKKAIYNTSGGPFKQDDWGGSTYKENKIFLHLRAPLREIKINTLLEYKIIAAKDLATGANMKIRKEGNDYFIAIPSNYSSQLIPVIELVLNKPYKFSQWLNLTK